MAGNADNQYAPASSESNPGGSWGAAPPIMHSWCLQSDEPAAGSMQTDSRDSKARLANDADDDCGFDLNLGLSLGGGKSSKPKGREKEVLLDRDTFRDKDNFRAEVGERRDGVNGEEAYHGGVMFKPFKAEQDDANANPNRVQHSFWQDLDRGGGEAKEKAVAASFPPRQVQAPIPSQQQAAEPGQWAGENSVAEDSKMFARHMWQALQGKAAQPEHQRVPLSAQDEASLIKELQGLPPQAVATAAAFARVVAQGGFPMQILEAIKDGVDPGMSRGMALQRSMSMSKSHSSGPHSEAIPAASPPMSQQTAAPSADLERSDSDVSKNMQIADEQHRQVAILQQQEIEQQRKNLQTQKRQEARRKRKALLEGQKSKKSSKKEDERPGSGGSGGPGGSPGSRSGVETPPSSLRRTSSLQPSSTISKENSVSMASSPPDSQDAGGASSISAFRRPGSTSWLHNWDANSPQMSASPAKAKPEKDGRGESGEHMGEIRRALDRVRDRGAKERGEDSGGHVEASSEVRKMGSPDVVQMQRMDLDANTGARQVVNRQEGSSLGFTPGMMNGPVDPAWVQKVMEMGYQINGYQNQMMQRRGEGGAERASPMAEPEKVSKKRRASSQTSSGGTESSGGQDEKSGNGARVAHGDTDALSPPAGEPRPNPPMMPSVSNAMAMTNLGFPQGGGFPMMPGAFPFPLPVPPGGAPGGVPFSVPFPFPYLMQFAPNPVTAGDGNPEQRPHPSMSSPFQIALPAGFNPPFQIQAPEGASAWPSAVVRPHATPPQSPPRSAAAKPSQSGLSRDDDKHGPRGAKGKEHGRSRNTSPTRDSPAPSLVKSSSMGSGAFNRLRTAGAPATSSPLAPQFGISRSKSDAVALRREGSVGSAFAAPVEQQQQQQPQQPPFQPASNGQSSSPTESGPKGALAPAEPANSRSAAASVEETGPPAPQPEVAAAQSTSEEGARRSQPTGVWRQGSLPSFEGIAGQEASSLRPGVAPGLHFGGTGSPPDLPWVTCNGTISGVLYRVEKGQVRIVCACHGRHMTPAEFVQHAGCGEIPNPEKAIVVGPFVMPQQAASAQA